FFFQAEDGIRDRNVTGVQTCALPILISDEKQLDFGPSDPGLAARLSKAVTDARQRQAALMAMMPRRYQGDESLKSFAAEPATEEIGRASCRERVEISVGGV